MTGPEHYKEAERLLTETYGQAVTAAERMVAPRDDLIFTLNSVVAQAQAHATLALVAATIDAAAHPNQSQVDYLGAWMRTVA